MGFLDQVIVEGNAVYEIDPYCKSQIRSTELKNDKESMLQWMLLLILLL